MTDQDGAGAARSGRRELAGLLLGGAVGAGLVLLGTRQQVANVIVTAPHPLPVTITPVDGQVLLPAVAALAVAALASLAAVLATRGRARRITGLVTAALGVGVVIAATAQLRAADVLTAAGRANISPANGAGGGIAPGSTTAGTSGGTVVGGTGGSLAGFPAHVEFAGSTWRVLILAGAALIVIAGLAIIARATKLPAMSSRYERSAKSAVSQTPGSQTPGSQTPGSQTTGPQTPGSQTTGPQTTVSQTTGPQTTGQRKAASRPAASVAAGMWDSLNAGADPTVASGDDGPN